MYTERHVLPLLRKAVPSWNQRHEASEKRQELQPGLDVELADLARWLICAQQNGTTAEFPKFFQTLELVLQEGDAKAKSLVMVGLIENMQGFMAKGLLDPEPIRKHLREESRKAWDDLAKLRQTTAEPLQTVVFDWGDTLMVVFPEYQGPMVDWPQVALVPGVIEALESLRQHYVLCVASNAGDSDAGKLGLALERAGIRSYFEHLLTSKELGFAKPQVEFYTEIARRLDCPPAVCMMVGNDYDKDIVPAKIAGFRTVLLKDSAQPEAFPAADMLIPSLARLKQLRD